MARDGARDGDALLLAAGKLVRQFIEMFAHTDMGKDCARLLGRLSRIFAYVKSDRTVRLK
jgi:hypothetical protein